jgi:hypothetical protein
MGVVQIQNQAHGVARQGCGSRTSRSKVAKLMLNPSRPSHCDIRQPVGLRYR